MHDAGAHLAADAGQVWAVVQQAIHQGAVFVARRRMHGETGRFVDHDQMLVLEQHIEGHGLGHQVGQGLGRRHPQLHCIPLAQGGLSAAGDPVHPHITGLDELLDPGAALLRPLGHQPAIQPHRQGLGVLEREQFAFAFAEAGHGAAERQRSRLHPKNRCTSGFARPRRRPVWIDPMAHPLKVFPAMVSASFEALTTLSNGISRPGDLGSRVCCLGIAILGQL